MADHRAEQIIAAVLGKVTGLTTTGTRAYRGRIRPLQETELPALLVYLGPDKVVGQYAQAKFDSELAITLEAVARTIATQVDTLLNQIRKEVAIALQADHTQGLAFVLNTTEGDTGTPELSGEGDQPIATLAMEWRVLYRRSRTDPST